jgi:predicted nuclease of restriction endonuclease-like (RecB) superfamily
MIKKTNPTINYATFFKQLKERVRLTQIKATFAANSELIKLYWEIGKSIVEKQKQEHWGTQVIDKLCRDLQHAFPGIAGFSKSNIFRMRAFYLAYAKVAQTVPLLEKFPIVRIPWGHNILLIRKIKTTQERLWYAQQTIDNGLNRDTLDDLIDSGAFERQGNAITNFDVRLPVPQSKLAQEALKDPYNFDFLTLTAGYHELELEQGLIDHIQKLLLELGKGFAFIGRQYYLEIAGDDYYLDLLFYHVTLKCYCIIELKTTPFKPEYAGKMNFYLSALDDQLKKDNDNPSIGIILCKTKNNLKVEYALRDINKPMGVSGYLVKIMHSLPKSLKSSLPTIEDIEAEFEKQKPTTKSTKKIKTR